MKFTDSKKIPGMVETVEQKMLYDCASNIELLAGECVVEFGTFFGRSTYCLAEGVVGNSRRTAHHQLHAYDNFHCDINGRFASYVTQFAASGGREHLLIEDARKINFRKIFEHYLDKHISTGLLVTHASELADAEPPEGDIALMHVDCPKVYAEFKHVLSRFFPRLRPGSIVIFQDYFYHWSATLIAAVQLLQEQGILCPLFSAASSLKTKVLQRPTLESILALDVKMQNTDIGQIIDRAIATVSGLPLDRQQQFLPRLLLAKVQHLWESGDFRGATSAAEEAGKLGQGSLHTSSDFLDLMKNGFSINHRYST